MNKKICLGKEKQKNQRVKQKINRNLVRGGKGLVSPTRFELVF